MQGELPSRAVAIEFRMGSTLQASSPLSLRVIIFFALNPYLELSAAEIARKFDASVSSVRSSLRASVSKGWLGRRDLPAGFVWGAGPLLLAEL